LCFRGYISTTEQPNHAKAEEKYPDNYHNYAQERNENYSQILADDSGRSPQDLNRNLNGIPGAHDYAEEDSSHSPAAVGRYIQVLLGRVVFRVVLLLSVIFNEPAKEDHPSENSEDANIGEAFSEESQAKVPEENENQSRSECDQVERPGHDNIFSDGHYVIEADTANNVVKVVLQFLRKSLVHGHAVAEKIVSIVRYLAFTIFNIIGELTVG
jgi:hypothetical protein